MAGVAGRVIADVAGDAGVLGVGGRAGVGVTPGAARRCANAAPGGDLGDGGVAVPAGDASVWARADLEAGVVLRETRGAPTPPVMAARAVLPQAQAHVIHSAGTRADHVHHVAPQ